MKKTINRKKRKTLHGELEKMRAAQWDLSNRVRHLTCLLSEIFKQNLLSASEDTRRLWEGKELNLVVPIAKDGGK